MPAHCESRLASRTTSRRSSRAVQGAIGARVVLLVSVLCVTAPGTAHTQTPAASAEMVAASARLSGALIDYSLRDAIKRMAEQEASRTALLKALADCKGVTGGSSCGKPTETDLEQKIAEVSSKLDALKTEQKELEAVAAAMKRFAESVQLSREIAEIVNGRSRKLAAALGITSGASNIDASIAVDPRVQRLVFRTGRLTHCFSTRSVCDARPYTVSR